MFCRRNSCVDAAGSVPVFLNVYDITPVNDYAYWVGLGVYHSGVEGNLISYHIISYHIRCLVSREC